MSRFAPLFPFVAAATGIALLSVMDGFMKSASLLLGAYSAMLWRAGLMTTLALPLWRLNGGALPGRNALRLHAIRAVVVAAMAVLFFHALTLLPIAQAIAISFVAPLIALYLAALLLKERIGRSAVIASLVGFVGALVICAPALWRAEPGQRTAEGIIAVLVSALLYAWNLILQRQQALVARLGEIAFFQNLISFLTLAMFAPLFARLPTAQAAPHIAVSAVLSICGLLLFSWAYKRAEAQRLVPIEYSGFFWAAMTGWVMFGERLTGTTVAGVVLVVAACLIAARNTRPEVAPLAGS